MNPETVAVNSSNSVPLSADRNELSPLYSINQDNKGLRGIIVCFTIITIIVSIFLAIQLEYGDYQIVPHGSVTSDSQDCSAVGVSIMKMGGNAVDALIATSFCLGVVQPHLTGLGGGGFLMIYDQRQRMLTDCLDFRVSADISSSIGIPGFVAGLAQAHKQHGVLPWSTLLVPAIEIARAGFVASESLMTAKSQVSPNTSVSEWISSWQKSSLITNPELADTLQVLANEGTDGSNNMVVGSSASVALRFVEQSSDATPADALLMKRWRDKAVRKRSFYKGHLSTQLANYFTAKELSNYKVLSDSCLSGHYKQFTVVVPGPGSGGPLLLQALGFLNQSLLQVDPLLSVAMGMRDVKGVNWTFNTGSHIAAIDHNDLYATVVSGLGSVFGSQEKTTGGYVLNNALDLSSVGSDNRPTSLSTPVIAIESRQVCGQRNILGGGDARDVAQVLTILLDWTSPSNLSLTSIIDKPRGRITGNEIYLEESHIPNIDPDEKLLLSIAQYKILSAATPYPTINIIHKDGDVVTSVSDPRGNGAAIVF